MSYSAFPQFIFAYHETKHNANTAKDQFKNLKHLEVFIFFPVCHIVQNISTGNFLQLRHAEDFKAFPEVFWVPKIKPISHEEKQSPARPDLGIPEVFHANIQINLLIIAWVFRVIAPITFNIPVLTICSIFWGSDIEHLGILFYKQ